MPANLENLAVATGLEKVSFHPNPREMQCQRVQLHSSHMLKILQARLQQYANHELPVVQAGFWKGKSQKNQRSNCQHPFDHQKSKRVPEKTSISSLLTMPKPLTVWITTNCGKFLKRWKYQTTWPASWEICTQVRKQQLKLDMEQ